MDDALRRVAVPLAVTAAAGAAVLVPSFLSASSHREAPSISQDPSADNTDVYAFRSPDAPDTATLIANFVPFEEPAGGPNFYRFSDDVKYEIKVDNTGDGKGDVTYEFRFDTKIKNPNTFLYNSNTVTYDAKKGEYTNLNLVQTYTVRKITRDSKGRTVVTTIGRNLLTPPNNVGRALDAELRVAGRPGDPRRSRTAPRSSPASVTTRSTSISAARSTCSDSAAPPRERSTRAASTACAGTASTRSPSRCRSSTSPARGRSRPTSAPPAPRWASTPRPHGRWSTSARATPACAGSRSRAWVSPWSTRS